VSREQLAQRIYVRYNKDNDPSSRIDLPAMEWLRYHAFSQFITSNAYPVFVRKNLVERIQREKPELYKQLLQKDEEFRRQIEIQQQLQSQPQK
jgi:hypothetical protein